jgi:hypothetical protein
MIGFSAASLATFVILSVATFLGAEQSAEKKSPAKTVVRGEQQ